SMVGSTMGETAEEPCQGVAVCAGIAAANRKIELHQPEPPPPPPPPPAEPPPPEPDELESELVPESEPLVPGAVEAAAIVVDSVSETKSVMRVASVNRRRSPEYQVVSASSIMELSMMPSKRLAHAFSTSSATA